MALNVRSHIDEVLHHCIHCGMCLPVCPTYVLTGREQSSPRGRIRLIRSVLDGSLPVSENFSDEMYFCLDCQACQTACPAGVHYGELVEEARDIIAESGKEPLLVRLVKKAFLRVLASPSMMKLTGRLLRLYGSTVRDAIDQSGILALVPGLREKHQLLPRAGRPFDETTPRAIGPRGPKRHRLGFLSGCIMNISFPEIHRDAVEVLSAAGAEILIPAGQVCCGSLHGHNGETRMARKLARANIDLFSKLDIDALVVDSAGCAAFLKEYGKIFEDDPEYAGQARELSGKVREITEFLGATGLPGSLRPLNLNVTYHDACHLVHSQKISREPRKVICSIPGVRFSEMPESTWCCGSAGLYNVLRFRDSMKMLERKISNLGSTRADVVATANPGCHIQIEYGIRKFGLAMRVMHPVSLVRMAMSGSEIQ